MTSNQPTELVNQLTEAQIGWVAGLIDMRGYLSDRPSSHADKRLPTLAITLAAVDGEPHPIITWLSAHTGVEPIRTGKGFNRSGCGEHCPVPHVHVTGTYHRWIVGGIKAVTILRAVEPYLIVRRAEAKKFINLGADRNWKPLHLAEMKSFGWPVDSLLEAS